MGFTGSVESFSLADVFQNLAMNQQTGTLRVFTNTGEEKNVYFSNGQVRHLSRGSRASLVTGDVFIARGLIDRQQLAAANEKQQQSGRSIGHCLIDLNLIDQEQLDEVIRRQIEEEIYDLFSWDHANFEFTDGTPAGLSTTSALPPNAPALAISQLIMEAARRVDEWDRLRKTIPQYKEVFAMDVAVRRAIESGEMEMDPVERRVAGLIDCAHDVDDLIEDSALFKFEVVNALSGFLQSSLIRPASIDELRMAEEECGRQNMLRRRAKLLERILALGGENSRVRRDLADLLGKSGETERACIHYSVLADAELQAQQEEQAVELFKRILGISPKHVKSHEQLAALYARRGKKREAFAHYLELFEIFREQNHMREARVAAGCALECDPSNTELRTSLIELLLADKQNEPAAQQLELMGDQAARQSNVKAAADCYRRALQCRPGNKQLKKKLADAMLTKEDRRSRKQRMYTFVISAIVIGVVGGALTIIEGANAARLKAADESATEIAAGARRLESAEKFNEAQKEFDRAAAEYTGMFGAFSPIFHFGDTARNHAKPLSDSATLAGNKEDGMIARARNRAKSEFDEAEAALRTGNIYEARDKYDHVMQNRYKDEEIAISAASGRDSANKRIAEFEEGKAKLKKNPISEFQNIEQESSFKRKFWWDFKRFLGPDEVTLPWQINPNTDGISVLVDGQYKGVVSQSTADREQNTFRLPFGAHRFEFRKAGYKSLTINTADLQTAAFELSLEREPAFRLDLQSVDPTLSLSGGALAYNNQLFVGTESGSVLQIGDNDHPIIRRVDVGGGGLALNKDVIGHIYGYTPAGKGDVIIYATRAGDCIAAEVAPDDKFIKRFEVAVKTPKGQPIAISAQAPPEVMKLKIYGDKPMMVIPVEQQLYFVDCEGGAVVPTQKELKAEATTAPVGVEQNSMIVIGCADGNVYGIELGYDKAREWTTGSRNSSIRGRPTFADEKLVAGTSDGKIYFFDPNKSVDRPHDVVELSGSLDAEPLVANRRIYVGQTLQDGFDCVDIAGAKVHWRKNYPEMGGVQFPAVASKANIYFCTDTGKLCCVDAERGFSRWIYQFGPGVKFACGPVVLGNRVYCFTKNGLILGFDESATGN